MSDSVRPQRQQPTRLHRPWDSSGKNTGVGCHFLEKWSCSVVSDTSRSHGLQPTRLLLSMGFSRQEYWSRVPYPLTSPNSYLFCYCSTCNIFLCLERQRCRRAGLIQKMSSFNSSYGLINPSWILEGYTEQFFPLVKSPIVIHIESTWNRFSTHFNLSH